MCVVQTEQQNNKQGMGFVIFGQVCSRKFSWQLFVLSAAVLLPPLAAVGSVPPGGHAWRMGGCGSGAVRAGRVGGWVTRDPGGPPPRAPLAVHVYDVAILAQV